MAMDSDHWDSVLQFVGEPLVLGFKNDLDDPAPLLSPIQIPTPPQSHDGSPVVDDETKASTLVSLSTTFYPGSRHLTTPPETILLTTDSVFFYVHSQLLLAASENRFRQLLLPSQQPLDEQDPIIHVPENSTVLNIVLHTVYDISCAHYSPSFAAIVTAVNRLSVYGIPPKKRILPSTPLFSLLLSHAPLYPLEVYALAASHDLYDLAVSASSHLLSFPLASLTDEMAQHIGPIYLKRLFFLHFGRSDALKRVLLPPPNQHQPTTFCDFSEQKKLTRAWALASAYLAWDARPDLSTNTMESALRPLSEHLTCEQCQEALNDRIKNLVKQWSMIKMTI